MQIYLIFLRMRAYTHARTHVHKLDIPCNIKACRHKINTMKVHAELRGCGSRERPLVAAPRAAASSGSTSEAD